MHSFAIVSNIVPFRIGGNTVIGARDVAAEFDKRSKSFDFSVNRFAVTGENYFIHTSYAPKFFPKLFSPRCDRCVPSPDFYWEHRIHAIFKPYREK